MTQKIDQISYFVITKTEDLGNGQKITKMKEFDSKAILSFCKILNIN